MKEYHIRRTDENDWSVHYGECLEDAVIEYYQDHMLAGGIRLEIRDPQQGSSFKVYETSISCSVYFTGKQEPEEKKD